MGEQCEHDDEEIECLMQSVERGAFRSDESLIADPALVALLLVAEHPDVALPEQPSGRAIRIVAELAMRVRRWPPKDAIWKLRPKDARWARLFSSNQAPHHS